MTATYTFDIFSSLDGYGSYGPNGDWGGYWGKQGPEFLAYRAATYCDPGDMQALGVQVQSLFQAIVNVFP